jgi:hypothetical protein
MALINVRKPHNFFSRLAQKDVKNCASNNGQKDDSTLFLL